MSETNDHGRLGQLMARRLKKLAELAPGKAGSRGRAAGVQPSRYSSALTGGSLLRSLERHRLVHDGSALGNLVTLMHNRGAATRKLTPESLLTRSDAIRGFASASEGASEGFSGAPAKSGRSAGDRRVKMGSLSTRRHSSAISKIAPELKAARMVADSASNRSEERRKERFTATLDERLKARKLNSHSATRIGMPRRRQTSALIAAEAHSMLGNAGRLAIGYTKNHLGQIFALRPESARATARLMSAKSKNGRNLAGSHVRTAHAGAVSEGNAAEHRRGAALKNSPPAQGSLRPVRHAPRRPDHSGPVLTVNFNPTVVLQAEPDQTAERNIVEALSRHSHELVQLIEQVIAKQRRVEFAS